MGNLPIFALGALLRWGLSNLKHLEDRPEISNPTNSWKRLVEGLYLEKSGLSPYDGVVFHEPPLLLSLFSLLEPVLAKYSVLVYILVDLLTCAILCKVAEQEAAHLMEKQKETKSEVHPESSSILMSSNITSTLPKYTAQFYLLNPFLMVNAAARTSTVWNNLMIAILFLGQARHSRTLATAALAAATYLTLYPIILIVPVSIQIALKEGGGLDRKGAKSVLATVLTTLMFLAALLCISRELSGSWQFLFSTYGFVMTVPELTPNMGIFWYFFTEMFEHFRVFFLCTFQLNLLMYCFPLSIRFWRTPMLLSGTLIGLIAVFKSYPCLGDVGFFLSLLPLFSHLLPFLKQTFLIGGIIIATTALAPILWHLWIYNNSANANYYFAINLFFSTAQIFLVTDLLFAQVKRDFYLKNGYSITEKEKDGRKFILQLK